MLTIAFLAAMAAPPAAPPPTPYVAVPVTIRLPLPAPDKAGWATVQAWVRPPIAGLPAGPKGDPGPPGRDATAPPIAPDASGDFAAAIQSMVDAAQAQTDAGVPGVTVRLPQRPTAYELRSPVYLDGRNVTLEGDGPGSWLHATGHPALVLGVGRLERRGVDPARFRVPSVLGGGRTALSTRGEAVLMVTAHPLQFGSGDGGSLVPDYGEGDEYTFEFVIGPGDGKAWTKTQYLFGSLVGDGYPRSWAGMSGEDMGSFQWWFTTADQTPMNSRRAVIPTPGPWPHAVTIGWSAKTASVSAWVDGKAQPVTLTSTDGTAWKPGIHMARHDAVTPFTFGGRRGDPNPLDVHGFAVSRGPRYDPAKPTETRLDGTPVTNARYSERTPSTVAYLPLDDAPKTHVSVGTAGNPGVGFWLTPGSPPSSGLGLRRLKVTTTVQQAVAVGYSFGVEMIDVAAGPGSLQGVGSVPIGCTYPVTLERCNFGGFDAAYYGFQQILRARVLDVSVAGRDGLRFHGGGYNVDTAVFGFHLDTTDTFIRCVGDAYGANHSFRRVVVDNEDGGPRRAVIEVEHAPYVPNALLVDDFAVSTCNNVPFIFLRGHRSAATGNLYQPGRVDARNLQVYDGLNGPALRASGVGSWYGTVDLCGLGGSVSGDTADVKVIPPPVPTPAP